MGKVANYTPEFRAEAVRLLKSSGRPVAEIASELGVARESLRRWARQSDIDSGEAQGMTTQEHEELSSLRRRVRVLEQEREILKKAAAFFALETNAIK